MTSSDDVLKEIDEALAHAVDTKHSIRDSKKHIISEFIDELLDARLEASK